MGSTLVGALNQRIREQTAGVAQEIATLEDYCVFDKAMRTPMEVAIEVRNNEAFDVLVQSRGALEFVPPLDEAVVRRIKMITREQFEEEIEKMEGFLERSVGEAFHWMRTPLLHACRHRNAYALTALLKCGAKLNARDVLGCSPPLLCRMTGGDAWLSDFLDVCEEVRKKYPVNVDLLDRVVANPDLYQRVIRLGSVHATAKRKVFNVACALLDFDTVREMIAAGHKINNSKIDGRTPFSESVSSRALWLAEHPESQRLAGALHRVYDMGKGLVMSGSGLEDLVSDLEKLDEEALADYFFADEDEAQANPVELGQAMRPEGTNPKFLDAVTLEARENLIDLLLDSGFDVTGCAPYELEDLLSDLIAINEPRLLEKVVGCGIDFSSLPDSEPIQEAIQYGCFDMVKPLERLGFVCSKVESHWIIAHGEYEAWRKSAHSG